MFLRPFIATAFSNWTDGDTVAIMQNATERIRNRGHKYRATLLQYTDYTDESIGTM